MCSNGLLMVFMLALGTGPSTMRATGFVLPPVVPHPVGWGPLRAGEDPLYSSTVRLSAQDVSVPPVRITYTNGEEGTKTQDFDLLVVACDPSALFGKVFQRMTPLESKVQDALTRFTFHTSLWSVDRPSDEKYAVRFNPTLLNEMGGDVYAFRDEVRAHVPEDASGPTFVTCYQLARGTSMTEQEFRDRASEAINRERPGFDWLGFEGGELHQTVKTSYFPHFPLKGLNAGLPWEVLRAQGEKNTLYVSSFTCFESVLQCYQYGIMMEGTSQVKKCFERVKNSTGSPRVAIIGAGPSGILFASQQLKRAGLMKDVTFFESTERYGGKTHTILKEVPGQPDEDVVCELGTCYLSAAYAKFSRMLVEEYDVDEPFDLDGGKTDFRGVYMNGTDDGLDWNEYMLRRPDGTEISQFDFGRAAAFYMIAHYFHMGLKAVPMPESKPLFMPQGTVLGFLKGVCAGDLEHLFTYAYQVQGYGNIQKIPAYYGLIWMTPSVFIGTMEYVSISMDRDADQEIEITARALPQDMPSADKMSPKAARLKKSASVLRASCELARTIQSVAEGGTTSPAGDPITFSKEGEEDDVESQQGGIYAMQQGWGQVWRNIVTQEGLDSAIKFNTTVLHIERGGFAE
eukprot:g7077.t1